MIIKFGKVRAGKFSVLYDFFSNRKQVQRLEGFFNEAINRREDITNKFLQ